MRLALTLTLTLLTAAAAFRGLRIDTRFEDTATLAAGVVGPFLPPAGNAIGVAATFAPFLRSTGVSLPGCTACVVDQAEPLKYRPRAVNRFIDTANNLAAALQPGGAGGAIVRAARSDGAIIGG